MALSGAHIACGYVGSTDGAQFLDSVAWSETMTSAGTTTNVVPNNPAYRSGPLSPIFEIRTAADVFVAIGAAPNATSGPRIFVPANETRNLICHPGDKVAWVAA